MNKTAGCDNLFAVHFTHASRFRGGLLYFEEGVV